jgi:23S rRNA (pseudouridine1915-N3)-methyltransferase
MKIVLIVVGKTDPGWIQEGLDIYLQRLKFYTPFELIVVPEPKNGGNLSQHDLKEKEWQKLATLLKGKQDVFLLDERGRSCSSRELAMLIEKKLNQGCRELTFVIGGPFGFSPKIGELVPEKISLSRMTFSHQMARLLLAEQLYRAFTIIKGESYHHD